MLARQDIALLKIVSESAVAGGVRRIEAVTHEAGLAFLSQRALVGALAEQLKATLDQLSARVSQILEDRRRLEREVSDLRQKLATGGGAAAAEQIGNHIADKWVLPDTPAKDLKSTADQLRQGATVICLVATDEAKASLCGLCQ